MKREKSYNYDARNGSLNSESLFLVFFKLLYVREDSLFPK